MDVKVKGGNVYYVIGSGGSQKEIITMAIVKTIAERNALDPKTTFQCMVKQASGAGGDPTVHRGWALYASVDGGWTKIAEEESVDGVWGVKAEILATVMSKIDAAAMEKRLRDLIGQSSFQPYSETITKLPERYQQEDLANIVRQLVTAVNTMNKKN